MPITSERNPITAIRTALMFLTRIPVRINKRKEAPPLATTVWAFPVVGSIVGLIGALAYYFSEQLDVPSLASAVIAVAVAYMVTGGLHEDGLADASDGFGGGNSRESKLNIMHDSRIGSYGVAAMILSILARVFAIASLSDGVAVVFMLIASGALSRAAIGSVMAVLPPARTDGLSVMAGRPSAVQASFGVLLAFIITILLYGFLWGVGLTLIAIVTTVLFGFLAKRQIGGQTGDVLGAVSQCVEIALHLAISAR